MSICVCHVLTRFSFPFLVWSCLYPPPPVFFVLFCFSFLDTTRRRRISLFSVLGGQNERCAIFHMRFVYFLKVVVTHLPPHTLFNDYSMQCLFLIRHNTNSNTLSATFHLINASHLFYLCPIFLVECFERLNLNTTEGNMRQYRPGPDAAAHSVHLNATRTRACSRFSLRQPSPPLGSHSRHTSTPASVPYPSAVFHTS
ncbi:hypothetical protein F5888DRAFT_509010 [Russula emetica]|nr:hypothetical protein F5888DRAFT_509010 [Russula emetica]